jgi:hypothetical protein
VLARASLFGASVVLSSTGCLITSTPTYDTPQQTPPILQPGAATPVLTEAIAFVQDSPMPLNFSATMMSEDAGQVVSYALLIDYGLAGGSNPYRGIRQGVDTQKLPGPDGIGTLADGPRPTPTLTVENGSAEFPVVKVGMPAVEVPTCHTVTMVATHQFGINASGCPRCLSDSSMLTWTVIACPSGTTSCPPFSLSSAQGNCDAIFDSTKLTAGCPMEDDDAGTCPYQPTKGAGP